MRCFNCGAVLKNTDYCGNCGADVKLYRQMLQMSNRYYNEGLEKARVSDLTGAAVSLRQSLKIYKKNTDARNLLGLIYFETGDVVDALTQWIISRSYQKSKNAADDYIKSVEDSPSELERIGTTIRKYNQSLLYCQQGSYDLAIIQLKKVLSVNYHLLDAHLLLALLYIQAENFSRARTEVKRVLEVDRTNTRALRYLQELDAREEKPSSREEKQRDSIFYVSGNETIIQPVGVKDNSGLHSVLNVLIGIVIGAAVMGFLIRPAIEGNQSSELNQAIAEYSDQLDAKTATLESMETELNSLREEAEASAQASEEAQEKLESYETLLAAYSAYASEDTETLLELIEQVDRDTLDSDGQILYDVLYADFAAEAVSTLYASGYAAYQSGDYETAIEDLKKCYELDATQGDALYFLARSYHKSGDTENAKIYYRKVVTEFPNTQKATDSQAFLESL
ncbi:MAG: tetratricopeptide repeat protein [Lachnospiraceae bacterium]|nr:tetratricopeptide repeat protein [Lachnospiraceae bacterium]